MAEVEALALEHNPKLIVAGWSAYSRQLDFAEFRRIADLVGAYLMVDMAHFAGLVAAGLHPNPVPYADVVTTTTHKTLGGPRGGVILAKEQYAKKINSAVFPGQQGGPLEHVIAAKAVAFKLAATPDFKERQERVLEGAKLLAERLLPRRRCRGRHHRGQRRHRCAPGPGGPAQLRTGRPAGRRRACTASASRSTATLSRSTPARRWSPPASGSARRPWPPAASAPRSSPKLRTSSPTALIAAACRRGADSATSTVVELRARVTALAEQFPLYAHLNDDIAAFEADLIGAAQ